MFELLKEYGMIDPHGELDLNQGNIETYVAQI